MATPTHRQFVVNHNGAGGTSVSGTLAAAPTQGDRIVVAVGWRSDTTTGVSLSGDNWTERTDLHGVQVDAGNDIVVRVYEKIAGASESATITATIPSSQAVIGIIEFYDADGGTFTLDVEAKAQDNSTAISVATGARAAADEYLVGFIIHQNIPGYTWSGDFTELGRTQSTGGLNHERIRVYAANLVNPGDTASKTLANTLASSWNWIAVTLAYRVTSGGGGGVSLPLLSDSFERTEASGWGTADVGGAWTHAGGSGTASVASGRGVMTLGASTSVDMHLALGTADIDATVSVRANAVSSHREFVMRRGTSDGTSWIGLALDHAGNLSIIERVNGALSTILASSNIGALSAATDYRLRLQLQGTSVSVRAWAASAAEPTTWLTATTSVTAANVFVLRSFATAATTVEWDALNVSQALATFQSDAFQNDAFQVAIATGTAYNRTATDTTSVTDSVGRVIVVTRTATDTNAIGADTVGRVVARTRTASDTVAIGADTVARAVSRLRTATDTVLIGADAVGRSVVATRTATDTLTTTDTIAHVFTPGSQTLSRAATDTTSVNDSLARMVTLTRGPPDTVTTTDAVARSVGRTRTATDTTTVTDAVAAPKALFRTATDTTTVSDSVTRQATRTVTATDTTSTSDTVTRSGIFTRGLTDTLTTSDAVFSERRGPTQYARPEADVAGDWYGEDARTTNLYTSVDDTPFSDTTYVESPAGPTSTDYAEFALGDVTDPEASFGHRVRYRYGGEGTATLVVELRQGTTVIASWSHVNPGAAALAEQTLTAEQADAITDYTDLRIRVRGS